MRRNQNAHQARQQAAVDAWNAKWETVVPVTYRRDNGEILETHSRSKAYVLSGHTAVILIDGISGCVMLDRVRRGGATPAPAPKRERSPA